MRRQPVTVAAAGLVLLPVFTVAPSAALTSPPSSFAGRLVTNSGCPGDAVDVTLRLQNSMHPPHVRLRVGQELRVVVAPYHGAPVSRPRAGSGRAAVCLVSWRYRADGGAVAFFRARHAANRVRFYSDYRHATPGANDPVLSGTARIVG